MRVTARTFGIRRVGRHVRERAQRAIALLEKRGEVNRDGERIRVTG